MRNPDLMKRLYRERGVDGCENPRGHAGVADRVFGKVAFAESEAIAWAEGVRKEVSEASQGRQELRWQDSLREEGPPLPWQREDRCEEKLSSLKLHFFYLKENSTFFCTT